MIRFDVITLFPEIFDAITRYGITGRAIDRGLAQLVAHNLRDYANDSYKTIDDRPYGGGPGMVMMPGPLTQAVDAVRLRQSQAGLSPGPVILLSPGQAYQPGPDRSGCGWPLLDHGLWSL